MDIAPWKPRRAACWGAVIVLQLAAPLVAQTPEPPRTATTAEIADLVVKLADERYSIRTDATRRLCMMGPAAAETLTHAAAENHGEAALRARHLLSIFDQCYFWGATVELSFSAPAIRWDEPVDLLIKFRNTSRYPVRLPFEPVGAAPGARLSAAQQVGVLFDIADFIRVTDGKGDVITAPTTDDLSDDPDVAAIIEGRAAQGISSLLLPGGELTVRVEDFNHGWSRYRLLDAGSYRVAFEFQPDWSDAELARLAIGRVAAAPAAIEVTAPAPPDVSRDGAEARIEVVVEERRIFAYLVNAYDKPQWVNLGIGVATPFAQFAWSCTSSDETEIDIPLPTTKKDILKFQWSDLSEVEPGGRVLVAETSAADLFADFSREAKGVAPQKLRVRAIYSNVINRRWQRRENVLDAAVGDWPAALRTLLPARLISARLSSETVTISDVHPNGAPPAGN